MPALTDESSSSRDFVWDKKLEHEFRHETDSRDALWIPVGLLTMALLWSVLLAFSFPASITGVSWIGGFIHDASGVLLRLFIIGVLVSCAAAAEKSHMSPDPFFPVATVKLVASAWI